MKKIIVLLVAILFLTGCNNFENVEIKENNDYNVNGVDMFTYCDKKYGIEYIILISGYKGGITVRLDENGNVIHCK